MWNQIHVESIFQLSNQNTFCPVESISMWNQKWRSTHPNILSSNQNASSMLRNKVSTHIFPAFDVESHNSSWQRNESTNYHAISQLHVVFTWGQNQWSVLGQCCLRPVLTLWKPPHCHKSTEVQANVCHRKRVMFYLILSRNVWQSKSHIWHTPFCASYTTCRK